MRLGNTDAVTAVTVLRTLHLDTRETRFVAHSCIGAFGVPRAFDARTGGFVAEYATRTIGIHAAAVARDTRMRIDRRIASFAHGAVSVFAAHTLFAGAVAVHAAAFAPVRARLAQFLGAHRIAAVAGHRIAVVATFIGLDGTIAATSRRADIRVCRRVAEFAWSAINVSSAHADVGIA